VASRGRAGRPLRRRRTPGVGRRERRELPLPVERRAGDDLAHSLGDVPPGRPRYVEEPVAPLVVNGPDVRRRLVAPERVRDAVQAHVLQRPLRVDVDAVGDRQDDLVARDLHGDVRGLRGLHHADGFAAQHLPGGQDERALDRLEPDGSAGRAGDRPAAAAGDRVALDDGDGRPGGRLALDRGVRVGWRTERRGLGGRPEPERRRQDLAHVEVQAEDQVVAGQVELDAESRHLGDRYDLVRQHPGEPLPGVGSRQHPSERPAADQHGVGHDRHRGAGRELAVVAPGPGRRLLAERLDGGPERRLGQDGPPDVPAGAGPRPREPRARRRGGPGRRGRRRRPGERRRLGPGRGRHRRQVQVHLAQVLLHGRGCHQDLHGLDRPDLRLDLRVQVQLVRALVLRPEPEGLALDGRRWRPGPPHQLGDRPVAGQPLQLRHEPGGGRFGAVGVRAARHLPGAGPRCVLPVVSVSAHACHPRCAGACGPPSQDSLPVGSGRAERRKGRLSGPIGQPRAVS
jgi:hypothetical protein